MTRDDVVGQICDEAWSFRTDIWDQAVNQVKLQPWIESWDRFFLASIPFGDQVEDQAREDYDDLRRIGDQVEDQAREDYDDLRRT